MEFTLVKAGAGMTEYVTFARSSVTNFDIETIFILGVP